MPGRIAAIMVLVASGFCFWLAYLFNRTGDTTQLAGSLMVETFSYANLMSVMLVAWAAALFGGAILGTRTPRIALALSILSPICALVAAGNELWALQQGIASLDFPAGEAIWLFAPALMAASFALGLALLGLATQLLLADGRRADR